MTTWLKGIFVALIVSAAGALLIYFFTQFTGGHSQ